MHPPSYRLTGHPLERELEPGSADWLKAMTASKVATVLGLTPAEWDTPYSLWHKMAGIMPAPPQTDAMGRGHQFEPLIRGWVATHNPTWQVHETGTWQHPEHTGHYANPDGLIVTDSGTSLLEIKTAADLFEWQGEVPPYYLAQAMWQMHVTGAETTWFAVCGPFELFDRKPRMFEVHRDDQIIAGIVAKADAFMASLAAGTPPPRADSADPTVSALRWRYPTVEKVPPVQVPAEIADPYLHALALADQLKHDMADAKAGLLEWMGTACEAEYEGQIIATRTNGRNGAPPSLRKARGADTLNTRKETAA